MPLHVLVAEKPSVARDIARVLRAGQRRDGYLETGGGDGEQWIVTWAFGHLAELKAPDEYDPSLKRWQLSTLPFIPERFELRPNGDAQARKQLELVVDLCRRADEVVCATDAGREGELIFRYILEFGGLSERPFSRVWLSSLTPSAIRDGIRGRRPHVEYDHLYAAAKSRSEADWIVGLNGTRAYTVRYGGGGILWSVGRVQTPVLSLVARRDDEIRTFVSEPWFEVRTTYRDTLFKQEAARHTQRADAEAMLAVVRDAPFEIVDVQRDRKTIPAPFLYDLTALQRDMNRLHGLSAARTLQVAQSLYEKKLISYPRTDCRVLPADQHGAIGGPLRAAAARFPNECKRIDFDRLPQSRRVFDDAKVTDHHAIVPVVDHAVSGLDADAERVFSAVARRLVQVFLPDKVQDVTRVRGMAAGVAFKVRGVVVVDPGWSAIEPEGRRKKKKAGSVRGRGEGDRDHDDDEKVLPPFVTGENGPHEPALHEGATEPPRPHTENTLLGAMETAGRLVEDEDLAQAMRGRGLGTPATRAAILETLLRRGYLARDKKTLRVTDLGRYLVAIVRDPRLKSPEMTGEWEFGLAQVERGVKPRAAFMKEIAAFGHALVEDIAPAPIARDVDGLGACPRCGSKVIEGQRGFGCSAWSDGCKFVLWKEYRSVEITSDRVRELLVRRYCQAPLSIDGEPRILCMADGGGLLDIAAPSRNAQDRGRPRGQSAAPKRSVTVGTSSPRMRKRPGKATAAKPRGLPDCPKCQRPMIEGERGYGCSGWNEGCQFVVWKEIAGKKIRASTVRTLVEKGKTSLLTGFVTKSGRKVSGRLSIQGFEVHVDFAQD